MTTSTHRVQFYQAVCRHCRWSFAIPLIGDQSYGRFVLHGEKGSVFGFLLSLAATTSEPIPAGLALIIVGLGYSAGVYSLLTGFHPRWRKTLRWARNWRTAPAGPPLSRYSHGAVAGFCFTVPLALCSEGFAFPPWLTTVGHVLAGVASASMIGGMIYDLLVWWCSGRAG